MTSTQTIKTSGEISMKFSPGLGGWTIYKGFDFVDGAFALRADAEKAFAKWTRTEIHAHNIIAQVTSAMESGATSDEVVPLIADLSDIDADKIADDLADLFEHLTIAADLAEDPAYAYFVHEPNRQAFWRGEDVQPLIDLENERALESARRIVATLRADMNRPRDPWSPPCE